MADQPPYFEDFDHALKVGFLAGTLMKAGVMHNVVRDTDGNYLPYLEIVIPEEGEIQPVRITIKVLAGGPEGTEP